jgi:hypothetical protein
MFVTKQRRRQFDVEARPLAWEPLPSFSEVLPNVWLPDNYEPTSYEVQAPIVETATDASLEYLKCQASLAYFVTRYCWTLHVDDPVTGVPTYRKFPTYPYLLEVLNHAQTVQNFHVEKSRQLLLSWTWMAVFLWDILFADKWGNVVFSTVENLVDDGGEHATTDSLFGKVKTMWQGLPPFLRASVAFRHMLIQCEPTGSYIRGRAATPKGGRGPAYKRGLMDEAAHMDRGTQLYHGLRASVKAGLVLNSSPLGRNNIFAQIRFQEGSTFRRLSYSWMRHPEHAVGLRCDCGWVCPHAGTLADVRAQAVEPATRWLAHECVPDHRGERPAHRRKARSPWYETATADYTPEQIASEYDISYEKSQRGRCYESFDSARHVFEYQHLLMPRTIGETQGDYRERYLRAVLKPERVTVVGMDFGVSSPTAAVLGQVIDEEAMKIEWLDVMERDDPIGTDPRDGGWVALHLFLTSFWRRIVREVTHVDPLYYGDPAGQQRSADLTSWISNLRAAQPSVTVTCAPHIGTVLDWIDFIRMLMGRGDFAVSIWCAPLIDALGQYHFPLDSEGNPVPGDHLPVHDKWSHMCDALRYVYKFRYATRLKNVRAGGPTVTEMLRSGPRDQPAPRQPHQF